MNAMLLTCSSSDVSEQPHKSMDEVMAELKTGDVVVSAGVGVGGAFMRITDRSIFSHASIIIRDPYIDQPCLWESIGNDEGWYPCMGFSFGSTMLSRLIVVSNSPKVVMQ